MAKSPRKPKKIKANSEVQHFENVARKIFKVPKSEIANRGKRA